MLYCLQRKADGALVSREGESYTRDPLKAAIFKSPAAALDIALAIETVVATDRVREGVA